MTAANHWDLSAYLAAATPEGATTHLKLTPAALGAPRPYAVWQQEATAIAADVARRGGGVLTANGPLALATHVARNVTHRVPVQMLFGGKTYEFAERADTAAPHVHTSEELAVPEGDAGLKQAFFLFVTGNPAFSASAEQVDDAAAAMRARGYKLVAAHRLVIGGTAMQPADMPFVMQALWRLRDKLAGKGLALGMAGSQPLAYAVGIAFATGGFPCFVGLDRPSTRYDDEAAVAADRYQLVVADFGVVPPKPAPECDEETV